MQNRKDLLQAHRLMTQRAALALLQAEPDTPDQPLRRLNVGVIASVLVAAIVAAVFGVWGLLSPGGAQGLTAPGTLIIDKETGTSYIWCQHQELCPVVNYASARLALGVAAPDQRLVSQASLAGYPRGPLIGIPGLPQPLPDPGMLVGQPWSVCVQTVTSQATLQQRTLTTLVGGRSVGGLRLAEGKALLVRAADNDWLIVNGQRMLIPAATEGNVLTALGATQPPTRIPAAWLNAFPQGSDFAPPRVPGFGDRVRGPGGGPARVGQVFVTHNDTGVAEFYVMLSGGLVPINQTQATLLNAAPGQVPQGTADTSQVAADRGPAGMASGGLPARMPLMSGYARAAPLCVVYSGSASAAPSGAWVTTGGRVPSGGQPTGGLGGVERVWFPPGTAALVGVVPGTGPAGGSGSQSSAVTGYFLVTGGRRYGMASAAVPDVLGYNVTGQRILLPAGVVDLIPQGPAFDPSRARTPVLG
jgi:type VII secretion protein EccB